MEDEAKFRAEDGLERCSNWARARIALACVSAPAESRLQDMGRQGRSTLPSTYVKGPGMAKQAKDLPPSQAKRQLRVRARVAGAGAGEADMDLWVAPSFQ